MSLVVYKCGCSIARSMYGEYEVMSVRHCGEHEHLFSQHKTLTQMAEEIVNVHMDGDK